MNKTISLLVLCFCGVSLWADLQTVSVVTPSSVTTKVSWANKAPLDPDEFIDSFFQAVGKEYYVQRLDKVYEETLQVVENNKNFSTTTVKNMYFFIKPSISRFPEAMVSFQVKTVIYDQEALKNTKQKKFPSVQIELTTPFKFYIEYFDFALNNFDIRSIDLKVNANSNGKTWSVSTAFNIQDLFIIKWLSAVKGTLRLREEPKVHTTLLFFKQRFDQLGTRLHDLMQKN